MRWWIGMPLGPLTRLLLAGLEIFVRGAGKDVHRLIVVSPGDGSSYLEPIFASASSPSLLRLRDAKEDVDRWCDEYRDAFGLLDQALSDTKSRVVVLSRRRR
jgi:hypothetical protein